MIKLRLVPYLGRIVRPVLRLPGILRTILGLTDSLKDKLRRRFDG
jgi:hypothetical protein